MAKGHITIDRILWVFKNKLNSFPNVKLVMDSEGQVWITEKPEGLTTPIVKFNLRDTLELDTWLDMLQHNEDPIKSYNKIVKSRK